MKIEDYEEIDAFSYQKWRIARFRHKRYPEYERLTVQDRDEPARALPINDPAATERIYKSLVDMTVLRKNAAVLNTVAALMKMANQPASFHTKATEQLEADTELASNQMFGVFG